MVDLLIQFIRSIGIEVTEGEVAAETFVPGIEIVQGSLVIDRKKLLYPGDLLHEAGHIAVTVPGDRAGMNGNVMVNNPEKEGEELAVLLWTYSATVHLQLPPEVVFHPHGYKGQSKWLIESFTSGTYIGLPLLVWMGMTDNESYPQLKSWLRGEMIG